MSASLVALLFWGTVSTAHAQTAPQQPAAASGPPAVNGWPTSGNLRLAEPMSRRLILNRGPTGWGGFVLERGGVTLLDNRYATDLDLAVAGSDRAVELALEAHSELVTGAVLSWTGLGLTLASLVGLVAVGIAWPGNSGNSQPSTALEVGTASTVGGVLVGVVLELVGIPYQTAGLKKECDAVNAYNSDLVDGLLRSR